jgi:thiamine-phosphate pyrophosphorylase
LRIRLTEFRFCQPFNFSTVKKYISKFHYLTQDLGHRPHMEQVQIACEAGANWIQYRCFSESDTVMIGELHGLASVCDDWGATLILTDHYHLLDKVDAQGVHLENMNADFKAIREIIGDEKTLGASANSIADIQRIADSGVVDYIGCGPFSITRTKPNDYAVLGIKGYEMIIREMKERTIETPLLAVGGIQINDVDALIQTGIFGIAVSAAVNLSDDPGRALKEFYHRLY